jgi:hypothetical protein
MQMKAAIAALSRSFDMRPVAFPKATEVAKVYATMRPPGTDVVLRDPPDLDEIGEQIRRLLQSGRALSPADLRHAPACLWAGSRPLDSEDGAADSYFDFLRRAGNRSMFKRLAAVYVVRYPVRFPRFRKASQVLSELAGRFHGPWSNAHKSLSIFAPDRGPGLIASAALHKRVPPMQTLIDHGLRVPFGAGLTEAAFVDGLRKIADGSLGADERLETVKFWIRERPGRPEHDENRGAIADALLLPYQGGFPEKRDRDRLLSFLLERYADPRMRPENWRPMPNASSIARKWLIEQSLRQFLDVVSESVKHMPEKAEQWRYRRAFWTAIYDRQLISDACVIFDEEGSRIALRVFEGKTPYASWVRRAGEKQIQSGHACLLLRIGPAVVAEWSHNGKCNIWKDANDISAPALHRETYSPDEADEDTARPHGSRRVIVHRSPATYSWQTKVADVVAELTNVRVLQDRYAVR